MYLLRVLATEAEYGNHDPFISGSFAQEEGETETFFFRKICFKKHFNFSFESIIKGVASNKDFSLRLIPTSRDSSCRQLGLYFIPAQLHSFRADRRLYILRTAFDVGNILSELASTEKTPEHLESYQHRKKTISTLFELLRGEHRTDILHCDVPENLECEFLKATLRPYQTRAVQWLLHREIAKENIPHNFVEIRSFNTPDLPFFLQPGYLEVTVNQPGNILLPTGGILADEMGLGKTVEMLALFLLNKRGLPITSNVIKNDQICEPPHKRQKLEVSCSCGKISSRNVVQCNQCNTFQHIKCTRKYAKSNNDDSSYLCPKCWEDQPQIKSNSTIIVSPGTIRQQWNSEIARHTNGVSVFTYDGVVATGWISPIELSQYDIVLTDYNVLKREINFSHDLDSQFELRGKKKYLRKASPLNMIEWWRVILDEAQMVESGVSKTAQMVHKLTAIHRWAVTGTPIQKSIDDIRGLLEFLDVLPFYKEHIWSSLSAAFQRDDRKTLLNVLSKVMWRTCKANVLEELGIPPQTEKVHYLVLSDVQRLFYRGQHSASMWAFDDVIRKFPLTMPLSQLDPKSLKKILEPLRKLRQDCTVPVIFKKMEQSQVKKCLTPKELVAHLISTNEIESKNHLRCMVSSINGQAAIRIIRKEFGKAVEHYKSVLDLAEKYNETICVDTLLQIHALHNLVEINTMNPNVPDLNDNTVKDYKSRCDKLEWKYLSIYNENFLKAQETFHQAQKDYSESAANLPKDKTVCWQSLLVTLKLNNLDVRFFDKINEEFALTNPDVISQFRGIDGISYFITNWVDKIFRLRDEVLNRFQKFRTYIENIKPQSELTEEGREIIEAFVRITFDCHLFELQETSKKEKKPNEKRKRFCDLCKAKKCLDEYECIIFSKIFDENREYMEGSWKPTIQESFCRMILRFIRASDIYDDDVVEANEFLKMLECIKTEYKEFIKLWIEIEYTVKAYDEINMCKLRLQLFDETQSGDKDDKEEKANYQIRSAEVDYYLEELANDYLIAETQFQRKLSRLKYIRHLESNEDPGICPVCKQEPDAKYSMLQCGHHMCMMCLAGMKEFQRNVLTCAVCRFRQKYEEVYFVTRKLNDPDLNIIEVLGQHSSKVEEIVREVLRLKQSESDVKIIIFSHWYNILDVIAQALIMNDVKIAFKQNVTQAINAFKNKDSNFTCLLLMLSQGSKGLNLTEATHVFLVEPILNPGEEQQAIGRIHRIGQTKPTTVHRFIMKETIEETIYNTVNNDDQGKWDGNDITINNIKSLFALDE